MKISFFEEFPNNKNLIKLKLITWNCNLFIGAKSTKDFEELSLKIKRINKKITPIYWPILNNTDGYWISPFTKRDALKKLFSSLSKKNYPVMLDLELPYTRNKLLFFTQFLNSVSNNFLINQFIKKYKKIYTAEYLFEPFFIKFMFKSPDKFENKVIKMVYSSMRKYPDKLLINLLTKYHKRYGNNLIIGLGTIATGILGNEHILSTELLIKDLKICKDVGIKEVVIFRLEGLNKTYFKVINQFR